MTLQQQHDAKRKQYMANEISHEEFYLWLADSIGIGIQAVPFSIEKLKTSKDPHFNDLPLITWDRMDGVVRSQAVRHGMRAWSLSDTVCVLKNVARKAVNA